MNFNLHNCSCARGILHSAGSLFGDRLDSDSGFGRSRSAGGGGIRSSAAAAAAANEEAGASSAALSAGAEAAAAETVEDDAATGVTPVTAVTAATPMRPLRSHVEKNLSKALSMDLTSCFWRLDHATAAAVSGAEGWSGQRRAQIERSGRPASQSSGTRCPRARAHGQERSRAYTERRQRECAGVIASTPLAPLTAAMARAPVALRIECAGWLKETS